MTIRIRETSRLRFANLSIIEGVESWDLPIYPVVEPAQDDLIHIVELSDRIDRIANRYYQAPDLWWVIALANDYKLLPVSLKEGHRIRIPSGRRVFTEILRRAGQGKEGK